MKYFLLILAVALSLWIASVTFTKICLDYRSYKFISEEMDTHSTLEPYDQVFYTKNYDAKNSRSYLRWFLWKINVLTSRS
jgi:hypothetical protein